MKKKFTGVLVLCLLASMGLNGQTLFVPGGLIGNSTTANAVGVGTSAPRGRLEIFPICSNGGSMPSLLVSRPGNLLCAFPQSHGSYFEAREYNFNNTTFTTRFIVTSGGRVGVGTNAPAQAFHVSGNAYTTGNSTVGITQPSAAGVKLHVHDGAMMVSGANGLGGAMILFSDNVTGTAHPNGRWGIEYIPNLGLNFWQPWNPTPGGGANYQMFIKDDGKVGIGIDPTFTSANMPNSMPNGYRLFVKDGIMTEKLKVAVYNTVNWADYVFVPGYERNSLEYVEQYVSTNGHLPNVPSAETVCAEGIDVAQMDAALLRQIEELWLHVIDLKKENEELKKLVNTK